MTSLNNFSVNRRANTATQMVEIMYFLIVVLICVMAGSLLVPVVAQQLGISNVQDFIASLSENSDVDDRSAARIILLINQLFTFIIPSIIFVAMIHKSKSWAFLQLQAIQFPNIRQIILGVILILVAFAIAQLLLELNQMIELPSSAADLEEQAGDLTKSLLVMETPLEFLATLLVIAAIPAIGEELMFRGIIQNYLSKYNPHIAIWVTAFVFSALHLQFAGFLPRFFLGAVLGYLMYWSGSLWLPMIAHFIHNGAQVSMVYAAAQQGENLDVNETTPLPWFAQVIAILIFVIIAYWFHLQKTSSSVDDPS